MTQKELLSRLRDYLRECAGFEGDKIASDRKDAWDYYFMRPSTQGQIPGRSNVVSGDLSAMVEAVLSQMDNAFTTDNIAEFQPLDADDVAQAQLESDAVCEYIARNNGRLQLLSAIKNALIARNAVCKVYVEEKRQVEQAQFEGVQLEAYAAMIAAPPPGVEVEVNSYDPESGALDVDVIAVTKKLRVESLALSNFLYLKDHNSLELQDAPFYTERHVTTRGSMVESGFKESKVKQLKRITSDTNSIDKPAQAPGQQLQSSLPALDWSQETVEYYESYVFMAKRGGQERRRICWGAGASDSVLLSDEAAELAPHAAGQVFLNPGRFTGISLYDKLKQTQDINTALERGLLDNVNAVNKSRTAALDGVANMDDLSNGRIDGVIRVKYGAVPDVRQAVMPFQTPDNSGGILSAIQDQKQRRSELGGAALTLSTGELQLSDRAGSQGIDRAYSVMEELSAHMIRNIADTLIRSLVLLVHETMRRNFDTPITLRQNGRWKSTIPAQWPKRERVFIKIGMSPGERSRRVAMLGQMMSNQVTLATQGMDEVLVDLDSFYATMIDWARAGDVPNPERYWVDPQSPRARKALEAKAMQSREQNAQRKELMRQAVQLESIRTAVQKYGIDVETQFKYYDANLDAQLKEAELAGSATIELIKLMDGAEFQPQPLEGSGDGEDDTKGTSGGGSTPKSGSGASGKRARAKKASSSRAQG